MFRRRLFLIASVLAAVPGFWQVQVFAQQSPDGNTSTQLPPSSSKPDETEIPLSPAEPKDDSSDSVPAIETPNFASCQISELRKAVPELAHLRADADQSKLGSLLNKIGDTTAEVVRKTPNLISHEAVVSEQGMVKTRQSFSYLVLPHARGQQSIVFDEFRIDLDSGKKFETEDIDTADLSNSLAPSFSADTPTSVGQLPVATSVAPPLTQGFANAWVYFYPLNRSQSQFRYLGRQRMDGFQTLVVAFAQKPEAVRLPAIYRYQGKSAPMYFQGVAWVNGSDFRIVRLRVDLLSPLPRLGLRQLTADIEFGSTRILELPAPLWLPHQVMISSNIGGQSMIERHKYTDYRLFRTHSKMVLNP